VHGYVTRVNQICFQSCEGPPPCGSHGMEYTVFYTIQMLRSRSVVEGAMRPIFLTVIYRTLNGKGNNRNCLEYCYFRVL
jgi:hypothetical protein